MPAIKTTQSRKLVCLNSDEAASSPVVSVFKTSLGWFSLMGQVGHLIAVKIGHPSRDAALAACRADDSADGCEVQISDWNPDLRQKLEAFTAGTRISFSDVTLAYRRPLPEFRQQVILATRTIPYGSTMTYLELASLAGSPRAARAVGSSMATNRFPIIVPCHRVVASGGKLGGFTAPGGLDLKQQLLAIEMSGKQRR